MAARWGASGRRGEFPRLRPRAVLPAVRVEFGELTPETVPFIGQAAYIQLELFENLARAVTTAPNLADKEGVSVMARVTLKKHHRLIAELRSLDQEPASAMAPFAPAIDAFRIATQGSDWYELLLTSHITAGILDEFFISVSGSLPVNVGPRLAAIIGKNAGADAVVDALRTAIAEDPTRASRLAMWGRRLVGDTLLVARSALRESNAHAPVEERIEPVFTELIAAHTRRMDQLGLTA